MYPEVEVMNHMIITVTIFFNYFRSQHTVFHSGHSSLHSWVQNWCFSTVVLEKTLESPLDYKEIKPVNPKGNHSWIFIGRTDAEAEAPVIWPPDVRRQFFQKDPDAGKDWRQEEEGTTEDEVDCILDSMDMSLSKCPELMMDRKCCSPWGCKESDMTEPPNWTEWQTWKLYLCVAATAKSL